MGLFSKAIAPEDQTSAEYLASAPPGPRTEVLAASCAHQIRERPVAAVAQFGVPLTVPSLDPYSALVKATLEQDRDLSAFVARKSMVHLNAIINRYMHSDEYADNLDLVFAAAGVAIQDRIVIHPAHDTRSIPADELDSATAIAALVLDTFTVVVSKPMDRSTPGYAFYASLFTGEGGHDELSYDIIAWQSVVLGRLANGGHIKDGVPTFDPVYRTVPRMHRAGWYPNPPNFGGIVDGDAMYQRFWNGDTWTDRVRKRNGRGWELGVLSLHAAPVD